MKEFTCIVCPRGCTLNADTVNGEIKVTGYTCARGKEYAISEMTNPVRNCTFNLKVNGGDRKVIGVKTMKPVSVEEILKIAADIKTLSVEAPVKKGDEVLKGKYSCPLAAIVDVEKI